MNPRGSHESLSEGGNGARCSRDFECVRRIPTGPASRDDHTTAATLRPRLRKGVQTLCVDPCRTGDVMQDLGSLLVHAVPAHQISAAHRRARCGGDQAPGPSALHGQGSCSFPTTAPFPLAVKGWSGSPFVAAGCLFHSRIVLSAPEVTRVWSSALTSTPSTTPS